MTVIYFQTLQGRVQHVENELYDRPENEDNNIDINDGR